MSTPIYWDKIFDIAKQWGLTAYLSNCDDRVKLVIGEVHSRILLGRETPEAAEDYFSAACADALRSQPVVLARDHDIRKLKLQLQEMGSAGGSKGRKSPRGAARWPSARR